MKIKKVQLRLESNNGGISEEKVIEFEKKYKITLPQEYRNFLLKYNGGVPENNVFNYQYNYNELVKGENNFELLRFTKLEYLILDKTLFPENILSIAEDSNGNFVVTSVSGEDKGKIYFWDHELHNDENPDYSNLFLLASNFDDFINGFSYPYDNRFIEYAEKGNLKKVEKLVENGFDINIKRLYTNTPVVYDLFQIDTVKNKQDELYDLINIIIKKGLDLQNGILTIAASHGNDGLPFVKLFLECGANINNYGGYGSKKKTSLIMASLSFSEKMVTLLLKNGADPFKKDSEGKTARDWILFRIDQYKNQRMWNEEMYNDFIRIHDILLEAEKNWKG